MRLGLVIVALFAAFLLLGASNPPSEQPEQAKAQQAKPSALSTPKYAPYSNWRDEACYNAKDHDSADLCAQWRAAAAAEKAAAESERATTWSVIATILSGLALGALVVTLIQTERSLRTAIATNKITESAHRAWIRLGAKPNLVSRAGRDGLHMRIDFLAENIGQMPATHFDLESGILFRGQTETSDELVGRILELIETWISEHVAGPLLILAPDDSQSNGVWQNYESEEIRWWDTGFGTKSAQPVLVSAALYRTSSEPTMLQISWRSWYLNQINSDGRHTSLLDDPVVALDSHELAIDHFVMAMRHETRNVSDQTESG